MVASGIGEDGQAGRGDPYDVDRGPLAPLPAANKPERGSRNLSPSAGSSQTMEPTDGATDPARASHGMAHLGRKSAPSRPEPTDQPDRSTSSVLEVPIAWLGLTPPSDSLHLKVMEAQDAYWAEIWSSSASLDEQMAWARSQGAWRIRDEYNVRPYVSSFTLDALPAGLAWLAQLSSYQHLDIHPNGKVHVHLAGPRRDLQEIHRRLGQATELKVVRVADGEEGTVARGPQLTSAQRAAIEAGYEAGFFEVPRKTGLAELAETLGQSRSALSTLLARGLGALVEYAVGVEAQVAATHSSKRPPPPRIRRTEDTAPPDPA